MARVPQLPGRRIVIAAWVMLLLVLGLSLTPVVVGSFLGDDYSAQVDVTIARPPGAVWERVVDPASYPVNSSAVLRVLDLGDEGGLPVWEEEMSKNSATVRTLELEAPRRAVREITSLDGLMRSRWTLTLEPTEVGTRARVEQDVHIDATGMIGAHLRFVMRFMDNAAVGPTLYLERLRAELEPPSQGEVDS